MCAPPAARVGRGCTRGARLGAVALAALLAGCAGTPRRAVPPSVVVQAGDTLYAISWRHGLDYRDLARWNGIGADYRIRVGQTLRLSAGGAPAEPRRATTESAVGGGALAPAPRWVWPAEGARSERLLRPPGGAGLRIAGRLGQPIRAAAAGRVVYTGTGLRGYGQLVIIKHDDTWLSAYGCNSALSVAEGETVSAGQTIAAMGHGPDREPQLYFEIRANGRPVDPTTQLPPR